MVQEPAQEPLDGLDGEYGYPVEWAESRDTGREAVEIPIHTFQHFHLENSRYPYEVWFDGYFVGSARTKRGAKKIVNKYSERWLRSAVAWKQSNAQKNS